MEHDVAADLFISAMGQDIEPAPNQVVEGQVIAIRDQELFVSSGGREVLLSLAEFPTAPEIGDTVAFVYTGAKDGIDMGSHARVLGDRLLENLEKDADTPVRARIQHAVVQGDILRGFDVKIYSHMTGFVPASHMPLGGKDPKDFIGCEMDFALLDISGRRLVLSRRIFEQKHQRKAFENFIATHTVGSRLKARVTRVEEGFVRLETEDHVSLFLHISDFAWRYLPSMVGVCHVGDDLEVQVLSIDMERRSIKVGSKQTQIDPWTKVSQTYHVGDTVDAKVLRFRKNGAWLSVSEGVEVLLPLSELSWTKKVTSPSQVLEIGQGVRVRIQAIDTLKHHMTVSFRELLENPWESVAPKLSPGSKVQGTVVSITEFGLFVALDTGLEGLLRIEDLSWQPLEEPLKQRFKQGETLDLMVLSVDPAKQRLRLGLKQLEDGPLTKYEKQHPVGSVVEGLVISEVTPTALYVNVGEHISGVVFRRELPNNGEDPKDGFHVGQTIAMMVTGFHVQRRQVEFSVLALRKREEEALLKNYTHKDNATQTASLASLLQQPK